jgi:hypothetical protein
MRENKEWFAYNLLMLDIITVVTKKIYQVTTHPMLRGG